MLGPRGTGGNNKILKRGTGGNNMILKSIKNTQKRSIERLQIFESENSVETSTKQSFIAAASQLEAK